MTTPTDRPNLADLCALDTRSTARAARRTYTRQVRAHRKASR